MYREVLVLFKNSILHVTELMLLESDSDSEDDDDLQRSRGINTMIEELFKVFEPLGYD